MNLICPKCQSHFILVKSMNDGRPFRNGDTWHTCAKNICCRLKLREDKITYYQLAQIIDNKSYLLTGWENKQHILETILINEYPNDEGETVLHVYDEQDKDYKVILTLKYRVPLNNQNDIDFIIPPTAKSQSLLMKSF